MREEQQDALLIPETGGQADFDISVLKRHTGGEVPSEKIARLKAELDELEGELKELQAEETDRRKKIYKTTA